MNLEELKKYISNEDLKMINSILTDNELYDKDKKNAFEIAWYLKDKSTNYAIHTESLIKLFYDVCMSKEIRNKSCFRRLLTIIKDEIQKVENPQCDNKYEKSNKDKYKQQEILFCKIYTSMLVAINIKDYNDFDFIEIVNKILISKVDHDRSEFINKIIENGIIKNNKEGLKLILDVSLRNKIEIPYIKDWDIYQNIFNILTNEDILVLDDTNYQKVVEIIIYGIGSYLLDNSLNQENLSFTKKVAIINYFNKMKKYCPTFITYLSDLEDSQNIEKANIFDIVYSDRLLSMNDKTYTKTLEDISNCNKPFSYVEVQRNNDLTDEQRNFVCELIKSGKIKNSDSLSDISSDYKQELAYIAISPILLKLPIEEYKKILITINKYCEKCEEFHRQNNDNYYYTYLWNKRYVASLFDKPELYLENKERLLFTINEILSSKNRHLSERITDFSTDKNSIYYNEEEYKKAIQLIKQAYYNGNQGYEVTKLFKNTNIPFMEDKTPLFQMALSTSCERIKSYTKELNNLGRFNMNTYLMFDGVDEKTINLVTNNQPLRAKKIVRKP